VLAGHGLPHGGIRGKAICHFPMTANDTLRVAYNIDGQNPFWC
jgi:hypothetical protein